MYQGSLLSKSAKMKSHSDQLCKLHVSTRALPGLGNSASNVVLWHSFNNQADRRRSSTNKSSALGDVMSGAELNSNAGASM